MRLFFQLTDDEQHKSLHHCADLVMEDIIDGTLELEPSNENDEHIAEHLNEAMEYVKTLETIEEKYEYLNGDDDVSRIVFDIALEMAKSAYYHEEEELVIFPSSFDEKFDEENEGGIVAAGGEEDIADGYAIQKSNKKISHLN